MGLLAALLLALAIKAEEVEQINDTGNNTSAEPESMNLEPETVVWAGRWETDMGSLLLEHIGREVFGKLEQSKGAFSGVTTTDPGVTIGQLHMTAFKGGFRIKLQGENAQEFSGYWWRTGSKERMPWSGQRAVPKNDTAMVYGDMNVEGRLNVESVSVSGPVSAAGLISSTITQPSAQANLPYLLSGVNCHWKKSSFEDCESDSNSGESSWGGYANVERTAADGAKLSVFFSQAYMGRPFCFVSFGGADTTNQYSVDAYTNKVDIFLKKKGCCAMDWSEFEGIVALICHGSGVGPS